MKTESSLATITVDASPDRETLFSQLCELASGEVMVVRASLPGIPGKRELMSLRAWVYWERKRMKRDVVLGIKNGHLSGERLETADPLAGVLAYLIKDESMWTLMFHKPGPMQITRESKTL